MFQTPQVFDFNNKCSTAYEKLNVNFKIIDDLSTYANVNFINKSSQNIEYKNTDTFLDDIKDIYLIHNVNNNKFDSHTHENIDYVYGNTKLNIQFLIILHSLDNFARGIKRSEDIHKILLTDNDEFIKGALSVIKNLELK